MATKELIIGSALYEFLGTAGTVPFGYEEVPQGSKPPYGVVMLQTGVNTYTSTSERVFVQYAVKIISNKLFPSEAWQVYGYHGDLLQDANISFGSLELWRIRRAFPIQFKDQDRFWHVGHVYDIEVKGDK